MMDLVIAGLLVLGGIFGLIGSIGLLKLRAPMQRLHAVTKVSTMGVGAVAIAAALYQYLGTGAVGWRDLLVPIFLFITAPLTALFLAKTHLHRSASDADIADTGVAGTEFFAPPSGAPKD